MIINIHQRKRLFIEWVMTYYKHVDPAVNHLLQVLMVEPHLLTKVSFSDGVEVAPRGIYISYQPNTAVPFVYYKDGRRYTFCEQAFHDIRLSQHDNEQHFYIELNFPEYYNVAYQMDVFEEHSFNVIPNKLVTQLDDLLLNVSSEALIQQLREKQDQALLNKNIDQAAYYADLIDKIKKGGTSL